MDALEAIRKRRSVRAYTGDPVPRADLETIVDAGRLAATGFNRQPWDFIVVTDAAMVDQLTVAASWMAQAGAIIALVVDPTAEYWLEGRTKRHEAELKVLLHVPGAKRLLTLVPIGVPVGWPTHEKRSLDEVIHWETY